MIIINILAVAMFGSFSLAQSKTNDIKTYVITETGMPTSFDPLEADLTQNLPVARMIYSTPVMIDGDDRISSTILDSFNYDSTLKKITFVVKSGLKYSSGEPMTTEDVAFSIVRMAFKTPSFPVLEKIVGVKEWSKSEGALNTQPKGITVSGNKIEISFSEDVKHPLFRFCLELFSVIPKKCVDLKTNKINCADIPASGPYKMDQKSKDGFVFSKRMSEIKGPEQIRFQYIQANKLFEESKKLESGAIAAGNEMLFKNDEIKNLKGQGHINYLPASRFSALLLNPKVDPFKDKQCRQIFATEFRKSFAELFGDTASKENSIFTDLIVGYMPSKELAEKEVIHLTQSQTAACLQKIKNSKFSWGYIETENDTPFVQTLKHTIERLKISAALVKSFKDKTAVVDAFVSGEIFVMGASSGFWAHDPSGDLQMLFTPNLHKILSLITVDKSLQNLIQKVSAKPDEKGPYKIVNQYIHDEALFNVYTHVRRFYFTKNKDFFNKKPIGLSAPAPWQVFE